MRKPRQREAKKHAQVDRTATADCVPHHCAWLGRGREVDGGERAGVEETELLSQEIGFIFPLQSLFLPLTLSSLPKAREREEEEG